MGDQASVGSAVSALGASPSGGGTAVLDVRDLTVEFTGRHGRQRVVDNVSFSLFANETLGLVGQSGSGKSISVLALMGLLRRDRRAQVSGTARLEGLDLLSMNRKQASAVRGARIAMVFQDPMSSLNPSFSVGQQLRETIRRHRGLSRREANNEAIRLLDLVGIPGAARRVDSYPHEFSGGMRQRVMTAIAVSCNPTVLIADEPTTALDVTVQAQILELLRELQHEMGMAVLFITHDLAVVSDICDRVAVMYAGQLVEAADVLEIFGRPLHPYTEALLCSTPDYLGLGERVPSSTGAFPAVGCRFAPRCAHARPELCTVNDLDLADHPERQRHVVRCSRADELELDNANALWERAEALKAERTRTP